MDEAPSVGPWFLFANQKPGTHRITLTVRDADRNSSAASVVVNVAASK